ncbi:MAG: hypothetical protein RMK20_15115 [Verrucomicrobiales bacterium]|nr:hypothetical protein [Verrucomicrobiales bacterium]
MCRRRLILLGIVSALAGLFAWPFVAHHRLKNAVEQYVRQLGAQGEPLTVPELVPPLPPTDQNAAPTLLAALAQLPWPNFTNQPPLMYRLTPGRALVAWRQDPLPNDYTTNLWPGLRADLQRLRPTLDQIPEALSRPALVVDVDYLQGFNMPLPHLSRMKYAGPWLAWRAALDLRDGRTAEALADVRAIARLVALYKDEPLLVSALVRYAVAAVGVVAAWELLQCPQVTEAQLATLQADWEAVDFGDQIEAAIRMERAMIRNTLAEMRTSRQSLVRAAAQLQPPASALDELKELARTALRDPGQGIREVAIRYPAYWAWRWWWSYEDELAALQSAQAALLAIRTARRDGHFACALTELDAAIKQLRQRHPKAGRWFLANPFELNRSVLLRFRAAEIQRRLLLTALALKRYERRHGRLPETLEALVPEFCSTVPRDPVDGQPLRYRPLTEGDFLLYSVGEDGTDDGGDASPTEASRWRAWLQGRDIVWPQPARTRETWLYHLEMELALERGRRTAPRVIATNGLPEAVRRELERLARLRNLELVDQPAATP